MWRRGVSLQEVRRLCPCDMLLPKELPGHASVRHCLFFWALPRWSKRLSVRCFMCLWTSLLQQLMLPVLRQIGGTREAGFDCGSEWLRRLSSGLSLFKDHLSLKPHGNESPQSSALVFLPGVGTPVGPHPLQPVPGPHKVKSIWNRKLKWVCLVSLPKLILAGFCHFCWWPSLMWLWEDRGVLALWDLRCVWRAEVPPRMRQGGNDAITAQAHRGMSEHIRALEFVGAHRERGKSFWYTTESLSLCHFLL